MLNIVNSAELTAAGKTVYELATEDISGYPTYSVVVYDEDEGRRTEVGRFYERGEADRLFARTVCDLLGLRHGTDGPF